MTLEEYAYLAEIIGVIIVVVTLPLPLRAGAVTVRGTTSTSSCR
jgi:hypothetical protein